MRKQARSVCGAGSRWLAFGFRISNQGKRSAWIPSHTSEAETMKRLQGFRQGIKKKRNGKRDQKETEKETEETRRGGFLLCPERPVQREIATEKRGKTRPLNTQSYPITGIPKMEGYGQCCLLKRKSAPGLTDYQVDPAADTLSVKCTVVSLDKNKAILPMKAL